MRGHYSFAADDRVIFRRCDLLRLRHRLLFPILLLCLAVPVAFAQSGTTMTMTDISHDDQLHLVAPSSSGQTGLFETVTADTLHHGDVSFGIYYQGYRLEAAEAPDSLQIIGARSRDVMR